MKPGGTFAKRAGSPGSDCRLDAGDGVVQGGVVLLRWVIGECLRQARQGQGRTLRDVAEAAGVSVGYLSEVERGRKEPSSEVLAAICRALGLDLVDLLVAAQLELARWRTPGLASRRVDVTLAA